MDRGRSNLELGRVTNRAIPTTMSGSAGVDQRATSTTYATDAGGTTQASTVTSTRQHPLSLHLRGQDPGFNPLPWGIENKFVNTERLRQLAEGYPNKPLVEFIMNGFRNGFNLGFRGVLNEQPLKNNKSARDIPEEVTAAVAKEVQRGHTAGPFPYPPFPHCHISPLGTAPKPDGSYRLCLDLSQPSGE